MIADTREKSNERKLGERRPGAASIARWLAQLASVYPTVSRIDPAQPKRRRGWGPFPPRPPVAHGCG